MKVFDIEEEQWLAVTEVRQIERVARKGPTACAWAPVAVISCEPFGKPDAMAVQETQGRCGTEKSSIQLRGNLTGPCGCLKGSIDGC